MLKKGDNGWLVLFVFLLLIATIFLFHLDFKNTSSKGLTFAMLDIGQGDALFIESPTGVQILVDAGPPRKILSALTKVMPRFDRTIDAIIITNPDQDHIGGFLDVLRAYKVGKVFEPGTFNESQTYESLKNEIENKNIETILAKRGMRIKLGDGAALDILFPDRDVSTWTTNDGSVVAKLSFGENVIMLTGDSTTETEKIILAENSQDVLHSTILKVGHHGSKTSTSPQFVESVSPVYAIISDAKDNKYGHPHEQTLATLAQFGAKVLRTDTLGTIVFKCGKIGPCETSK